MTGINGKELSKVILVDLTLGSELIQQTLKKYPNSKIVCFDYNQHLTIETTYLNICIDILFSKNSFFIVFKKKTIF